MVTSVMRMAPLRFGPESNGLEISPREFDRADFEEGWRYELINGVLIVSPPAAEEERDPNGELDYGLRLYRDTHPNGSCLDATIAEQTLKTNGNRRRADRVLWIGLGRLPEPFETPTIVIEFVSQRKRDWERDYETKRDEYRAIGVKEYWVIDRFRRTLTVFFGTGRVDKRVYRERQTYTTPHLPGFELPLARLLALADRWKKAMRKR
jgi:Uma2 family endonuclease